MRNEKIIPLLGLGALSLVINAGEASATEQNECVVTTSVLNVRSGAGTDKTIINKVHKEDKLIILESEGIWYKVRLSDNSEGWISSSYTKLTDSTNNTYKQTQVNQGKVTTAALNVRSGVGTSNQVVGQLVGGTVIDILDVSNGWYKVKLSNGVDGWCSGAYISATTVTDEVKDKVESVLVESENKELSTLSYIDYSNTNKIENEKGYITANSLNVRGGIGIQYSIVATLLYGTEVDLLEESSGWYKVKLGNGTIGWCSGAYISKTNTNNIAYILNGDEKEVGAKKEAIINLAKAQLGKPYLWGASGTESFDCSSFTQYVFKSAIGVNIPRVSYDQARFGKYIPVGQFEVGDLVYLDTSGAVDGKVTHVGIYIGEGKMIHASGTKENPKYVMITSIDSGWYKDRVLGARRLI